MNALYRLHARFAKPSTDDVASWVNPYPPHPLTGTEGAVPSIRMPQATARLR
jgi:hypothetical protein